MNPVTTSLNRSILSNALTSRFVEEALLELFSEGKLHGTVHTCIGQEATGAVISEFLLPGDTIVSNHRCHGHFISRHGDIEGLIAELMGRQTGVSGGIGGSQHLYKDGFFSNGIQGGMVPIAAGLAFGHKLRNQKNISVVFIGDGTLGEGVVYETFNIVSKWELPLLIVLEDNKYSQSTAQHETLAGDIDSRAAAFGIETAKADSWDWDGLHRTAGKLVEHMRMDSRPRFLRIETFRLKAHSKGDDIRPREEVEPFEKIDPINRFLESMTDSDQEWVDELRRNVRQAINKAHVSPDADVPDEASPAGAVAWSPAELPEKKRLVGALNETLNNIMSLHDGVFLLGEDILSPYGGAFKVTKGLSETYPGRVRNTPISEASIVGIGAGLGFAGYYPIVEIMFGDFIGLAFDQIINHAAKFQQMYNRQILTNVIVRTPMGGGRGYGPTHSQTLDKHFLGVPGLRVLAMNNLTSPAQLYMPLISPHSGPTLVIENKILYGSYLHDTPSEGFQLLHSDELFPSAWLRPYAADVDMTLVGYGGVCELLLAASEILFEEHDIVAQVLCVMQIYPFRVAPFLEMLGSAKGVLIVEEGQGFAGFGSEVIAQLAEHDALSGLNVRRHYPPAHCIPASGILEKAMLPGVASIVREALTMTQV
ncbi:MAG: pyruvate dehydrogenase [Chlorobiaceae bacterium]|nr:pyruvate dehydrogenase [Chlorobiaceae bacterium]